MKWNNKTWKWIKTNDLKMNFPIIRSHFYDGTADKPYVHQDPSALNAILWQ